MFKIEFSLGIAVYLILTMSLVFALWLVSGIKKASGSFLSEKSFFWQCNICTFVYVDSKHSAISQCPRCGSYNKKEEEKNSIT